MARETGLDVVSDGLCGFCERSLFYAPGVPRGEWAERGTP